MRSEQATTLTIVIPLYNEESNIKGLFARLRQLEERLRPVGLEIVFVDDCSQDQTASLVKELCRQNENVRLIRFAKNSGSHAAIMAGVVASKGDCVMFIAGDLQDPPEIIPELLEKWRAGDSIVWAARTEVQGQKRQDTFFSSMYWLMVHHLNHLPIPKTGVDFFLIDRKVVESIAPRHDCNIPYFQIVAETGFKTGIVYYSKANRGGGKSGWTLKKKLILVLDTLLFSPVPLRAFTVLGAGMAIVGALSAVISAIAHFGFGAAVDPFLLILIAMSFFCGLQMTMIGMVGEYLLLTLKESRRAPRYVVAERVNFAESSLKQQAELLSAPNRTSATQSISS